MTDLDPTDPKAKARIIVEAGLELKAEDPLVLDVSGLTSYADTFILLSGRSDRQVAAIADAVVKALVDVDERPLGIEGTDEASWVLIDCNDAIVHVFDPETREQYDLERLWDDAPRLDLGIPALADSIREEAERRGGARERAHGESA